MAKAQGVLIRSPSIRFRFGILASQLGAVSVRPSVGRASRSNGTCTVTMQASSATDRYRSYCVAMSQPTTIGTYIGPVMGLVVGTTCRAFVTGIGWADLLHPYAKALSIVGDEQRQLLEGPRLLLATAFARLDSTTCRCSAFPHTN